MCEGVPMAKEWDKEQVLRDTINVFVLLYFSYNI